ncbi:hypothetical protein ALC60_11273, partial [Trachymyrmex zeteki]
LTIAQTSLSNNHILFQSFPNLLFPILHTCPIIATAFSTLSLTCSSCPLTIFIFSLFTSNPFLSTYPFNLSIILSILPSSSANSTTSSAYANPYTLPSANFTPSPFNPTHLFHHIHH